MKRNENPHSDNHLAKKLTTNTTIKKQENNQNNNDINNNNYSILNLKDEIQIIITFQSISEILFLSLTCKEIYQQIEYLIKQQHLFKDNNKNWSIVRALREMNTIIVNDKIINYLNNENINDLSKIITNKFIINKNIKQFINILQLQKKKSMTINLIELFTNKLFKNITINNIPLGFTLKKLKLINSYPSFSFLDLFKILKNCLNLEYLNFSMSYDNDDYEEINKEINMEINNFKFPLLQNLKTLKINNYYEENDIINNFINILKLSPNLKYFKYTFYYEDNFNASELIKYLSNNNFNYLQKIKICSNDNNSHSISDNEILNLLKNISTIKYLFLSHCNNINGNLFIEFGKFAKNLEYLFIERNFFDKKIITDLYFNDILLPKLKYITIKGSFENKIKKKFFDSIYKNCLNLIELNTTELQNNDYNDFTYLHSLYLSNIPINNYLNCKFLQKLKMYSYYNYDIDINILQNCKWQNLKNLSIYINLKNIKEWLQTLLLTCPKLEIINILKKRIKSTTIKKNKKTDNSVNKELNETIIEILKNDNNWPNLIYFNSFTMNEEMDEILNKIRPLLFTETKMESSSESKENMSKELFYSEWLYGDKLKKEHW